MKNIGIICASDTELAPFLSRAKKCNKESRAMLKFHKAQFKGLEYYNIVLVYSGVCKVNAAIATQILIDHYHVDTIFNSGVAGGIDVNLHILDTVIPAWFAYHDVADEILTQYHPNLETRYFRPDLNLLKKALVYTVTHGDIPISVGPVVTGESFITDDKREEINAKFRALIVDMESTSIAHVCYVNKVAFLCVRTLSDCHDHRGIEVFEQNCERASNIAANIVLALIEFIHEDKIDYYLNSDPYLRQFVQVLENKIINSKAP